MEIKENDDDKQRMRMRIIKWKYFEEMSWGQRNATQRNATQRKQKIENENETNVENVIEIKIKTKT